MYKILSQVNSNNPSTDTPEMSTLINIESYEPYLKFLEEYEGILKITDNPEWKDICWWLKQNGFEWEENDSYSLNQREDKQDLFVIFDVSLEHIQIRNEIINSFSKRINELNEKEIKKLNKLQSINIREIAKLQKEINETQLKCCWKKNLSSNLICYVNPRYIGSDFIWINDSEHDNGELINCHKTSYKSLSELKQNFIKILFEGEENKCVHTNPLQNYPNDLLTLEDFYNCLPKYWKDIQKDLKKLGFELIEDHNEEKLYHNDSYWGYIITDEDKERYINNPRNQNLLSKLREKFYWDWVETDFNSKVIYVNFLKDKGLSVEIYNAFTLKEENKYLIQEQKYDNKTSISPREITENKKLIYDLVTSIIETKGLINSYDLTEKILSENKNN